MHFKNYIRKQFSVFGNILKMLFSYKFFTFSQLPNKFYIKKSTTTHTSAPTENPPPPTHQHPQKIHHYPHKIHHHTTQKPPKRHHPHHHNNNKKSEIKERKQIGDKIDLEEKIDRRVADDEIDLEEDETGQAAAGFMWRDLGGAKSTA